MNQYKIFISGSAPLTYPTDTFFGLLWYDKDEALEIPKKYPYQGEWGKPLSTHLLDREEYPIPGILDIVWLSVVERKFYSLVEKLPIGRFEELFCQKNDKSGEPLYEHIVVGMAPYGGVAVWIYGFLKSTFALWEHAEETQVDMKDFMPLNPNVTLEENCDFYINNDPAVKENLEKNGLPPKNLFDKYMQQFTYRYLVKFGKWNECEKIWKEFEEEDNVPELDRLEEALYDGTHDKLNDGGLYKYHEAGKPKKLALKWHINKREYAAYLWFRDEEIKAVFDRFYGPHPETKTDFIINIDAEKNKYQLSMNRYGLKEPYVITEDAYEMIVFRNKFECFRSGNYSQATGAWIW